MFKYKGGKVMTIKEVAKLAGVSVSTVSKIVNNKDEGINAQTRSRVLQIVKECNYTPYGMVKNTSPAKTFLLGVLLRDASKAGRLLNGILDTAQKHGYGIVLYDSQDSPEMERKHIAALGGGRVDGVIWEPAVQDYLPLKEEMEKQGIEVGIINGISSQDTWKIDYAGLGYLLTEKLLEYKHTNLVCLVKEGSRRSAALYEGFQKCLFEHQIPFSDKQLFSEVDMEHCQKLVDAGTTGIVSSHFALALEIYEQLDRLHYDIPSDFSIVSLKDDVREAISFPNISSIRIPYYEFGCFVAERVVALCEKIELEEKEQDFTFSKELDSESSLEWPAYLRGKRFVVVGAINMDITFHVDELPQHGKTTNIFQYTQSAGGKGVNQAVGVAKLGREVALIGEMGDDRESSFLFETLENEKVITSGIHRNKQKQTGKAYIYTESNGESAISILAGANDSLREEAVKKHQHLFKNVGYCLVSTEIPVEAAVYGAKLAKSMGGITVVKPAVLEKLPEELAKVTDILAPNRKEALVLCGEDKTVEEQADFLAGKGIPIVIITLGHRGCYVKSPEVTGYFPAAPGVVAVDTTGGADAFLAALTFYLSEGCSLKTAVPIASYAAGFCVSRQGTAGALVDRNTLEACIAKEKPELLSWQP